MEQSKNNKVFLPLQRGRKSLDNEACFSKLYVIRVDKATQTYGQKGIAEYCGFTAQFVENTPFPTSGPVEPAAVRLFIPGKKISTLFPDSPLLFYFFSCRRAAQWFVTGSTRQSETAFTSPRSAVPHTALRPPTKYFITLPVFFFSSFQWHMTYFYLHDAVACFLFFWSGELKREQRSTGGGSVILAPRWDSGCVDSSVRWVMAILFSCMMNKVPPELRWRVITFEIFRGRLCVLCIVCDFTW